MTPHPSHLVLFFGRFHPLLVHLPIGFIVLLVILEVLSRRPRFANANAANGVILVLASVGAIFSALCGWLLSLGGGYDASLLAWHKWTGLGVAVACVIACLLYWFGLKAAYRCALGIGCLGLIAAGHWGGSLTHGRDYLVRYAPDSVRAFLGDAVSTPALTTVPAKDDAPSAFAAAVLPVFQENCIACHGPEKSKARLRLDSLAGLLEGSKDGPVLKAGHAADSAIIKRMRLPLADDDHMPPAGKPQPSADDIALVQWWIDAGAPGDKTVAELKPPSDIQRILAARASKRPAVAAVAPVAAVAQPSAPPKSRAEALELAAPIAADLDILVTPLSEKEPWLECSARMAGTNFTDATLAKLAPLALNVCWLDLAGTAVRDAGLAELASMKNLRRLHLEHTPVTDAGLVHVAGLHDLEYLNLYATSVTDAGLAHLAPLTHLRRLYLWQTKVTADAANTFAKRSVNEEQIERWQEEIEALKEKIKSQGISVDLGTPLVAAKKPEPKPINTKCPVSGKDIDLTKTVVHNGQVIAFCCDKCKAQFEKDPKPFLPKLAGPAPASDSPSEKKP